MASIVCSCVWWCVSFSICICVFVCVCICQGALWRSWGAGVMILSGCQGQQLLLIIEAEGGICPKRTWGTPILSLFLSSVFCRTQIHSNVVIFMRLHPSCLKSSYVFYLLIKGDIMRNIISLVFWYNMIQNYEKYCNLLYSKLLKKNIFVISLPVIIYVRTVLWTVSTEI